MPLPSRGRRRRSAVQSAGPRTGGYVAPRRPPSEYANPLAACAARTTIETILEEDLVAHSRDLGARMLAELRSWEGVIPIVSDVRGRGLMIGLDLVVPGTRTLLDKQTTRWIFDTLLARGVLAMIYNPEVRINPPLVITEDLARGSQLGFARRESDRHLAQRGFDLVRRAARQPVPEHVLRAVVRLLRGVLVSG